MTMTMRFTGRSTMMIGNGKTCLSLRLILTICLLIVGKLHGALSYTLQEVEVSTELKGKPIHIFTKEEMEKFDGSDESLPIYMGIKGVVFDVSSGKRFYGKGTSYNSLVGKDCTRAVAKMSLDVKDLTHDISGLSDNHLRSLDETFEQTYVAKYPVVGYMDYFLEQYPHKFDDIVKTEL